MPASRRYASYVTYLRVYEPLAAFPGGGPAAWREAPPAGTALDRRAAAALEYELALDAVGRVTPRLPDAEQYAIVTTFDGALLACPIAVRRRSRLALADFRRGLPDELADAFVPAPLVETALAEEARHSAAVPDDRQHILSSAWTVPLHWFVLFDPAERRLITRDGRAAREPAAAPGPDEPAARRTPPRELARACVYATAMSRARRRLARALAVLRRSMPGEDPVDRVEDLGRWLEEFHPHSLVELDYGGVVGLLDDAALRADTSVADVAAALAGLSDGDARAASAAYESVSERWREISALERAN